MFVLKPSPRRLFFIFQELRIASQLAGTNYSKPEIELLMRLVDTDQDGLLTFPEFTSIIKEDLLKVGESDIPGAGEGLFARRDIQVHFHEFFAYFNPTQNKGIFRSTCLLFNRNWGESKCSKEQ